MTNPLDDPPPPAAPLVHQVPRRTDPLVTIGLVLVVATSAYVLAAGWSYWDSSRGFLGDDAPSTVDRLRVVANAANPIFAGLVLAGVVLASLRDLLRLLDLAPGPSNARSAARTSGAVVGALFAVVGLVAAFDTAFIRDDDSPLAFFGQARWQQALTYLAAAAIGAVTAWTVLRRDTRPAGDGPVGIWPATGR